MFAALALAVFKTTLGVLSGSMALQAHSLHSFGDFLTKGINLASVKLSSRPANSAFPYGYGKVQFLSANFIGLSLMAGAGAMLWYNLSHLGSGHVRIPEFWAVFGALISAGTAELMHRYLRCVGEHTNSPAILAAAADNRGTPIHPWPFWPESCCPYSAGFRRIIWRQSWSPFWSCGLAR